MNPLLTSFSLQCHNFKATSDSSELLNQSKATEAERLEKEEAWKALEEKMLPLAHEPKKIDDKLPDVLH